MKVRFLTNNSMNCGIYYIKVCEASTTIVEVKPIYLYPPLQSKAATPSYLSKFSIRLNSVVFYTRDT
jgi:hypothetical protein